MAIRSKQTLFNAALLRCGRGSVESETSLNQAMEANYDEIVRAALEDGDGVFTFGRAREALTSRSEGDMGFDDAFKVPNRALHIVEVYLAGNSCSDLREPWEYDGTNGAILINARGREVEVRFVQEGQESTWTSAFAQAIQKRLEAVIKDFLEETEEAIARDQDADFGLLKAGINGAKKRSAQRLYKVGGGRLLRARATRGTSRAQR